MGVEPLFNSLPFHWEVVTLGEACKRGGGDIQTEPFGSQLHASDYMPVGIPSIMPKNIGENRVDTTDIARITTEERGLVATWFNQEILFTADGVMLSAEL